MSHLDFYSDMGKIALATMDDSFTYTGIMQIVKDHVNTCVIVSHKMIHVLLNQSILY